ncbi:uncharacterized protein H6S33_006134 [Morchella sextelata]|uniref:uncharacterized protein n=1 Tax=Morchella sextelata TaxID=1174677 RepID=UPI001D03FAA8|nr:uncharacterized protein H6S33_006134 [Morchella sextelata]KAH0614248.1 hypothetical protein H6S33_006134 [Morchella sextelata]
MPVVSNLVLPQISDELIFQNLLSLLFLFITAFSGDDDAKMREIGGQSMVFYPLSSLWRRRRSKTVSCLAT